MFASMFKSLFKKSSKKCQTNSSSVESQLIEIAKNDVKDILISLNEIAVNDKEILDNSLSCSVSLDNIIDGIEEIPIAENHQEYFNDSASVDNFDETKSEVSSIGENLLAVEHSDKNNTANEINNLQCLFTWNIKPNNKKNIILLIQNKYGDYNLDISSSEFTFERLVNNNNNNKTFIFD